jgi:hypothetical protein
MWARAAVLEWPSQADEIHREFFSPQLYTHFHIHPIFLNETHASVRWTYTFLDMGMEFKIDKSFFISNEGQVIGDNTSQTARDHIHLRRIVFDHYKSYVANLRHLDCIMEDIEPMEQ